MVMQMGAKAENVTDIFSKPVHTKMHNKSVNLSKITGGYIWAFVCDVLVT